MSGRVSLHDITPDNWWDAAALQRAPEQDCFVGEAVTILALAYVHRHQQAKAQAIYQDKTLVGLLLTEDGVQEPACYHLHELLIDQHHQRQGIGSAALSLLLAQLRAQGRFPRVEVCVHERNNAALYFFARQGFELSDYRDPDQPWNKSMVYTFARVHP